MANFEHVKVGDTVKRKMGHNGPIMPLTVVKVDDKLIHCAEPSGKIDGWTFDRKSGVEEDAYLGWGVLFGVTGTYLVSDTDVHTSDAS